MTTRTSYSIGRRSGWALALVLAGVGLVSLANPGCAEDEAVPMSYLVCPNAVPASGDGCTEPGQLCSYVDPRGCKPFLRASCEADERWSVEDPCAAGGGGAAGAAPAGGGGAGGGVVGGHGGGGGVLGGGGGSGGDGGIAAGGHGGAAGGGLGGSGL